ncbi:MAG: Hpt domain-containing protein [Chloroflexi bacterium]|nr:Hpt domain-containing protein [Chloroflexota bacterium]MBK6712293.1 Hpt domain-containing protein [Chloroflexota bacterium]MBK7178918.1 Hpt domain-containing protein [Chloroflexota bacterium]MBK7917045.1 Hpt domain-containing protein [Chloroflexota bacterium]MBP7591921.1 Hpt domain-containing protein [Chloroflexota bacterium]
MIQLSPPARKSDPIDLAYARDIVDGDLELLQEIVTLFLFDCSYQVAALQEAVASGSGNAVTAKAHRLKCSLGNIGGWQAYQLVCEMELMGLRNDLSGADECLFHLTAAMEDIVAFFAQPNWAEQAEDGATFDEAQ